MAFELDHVIHDLIIEVVDVIEDVDGGENGEENNAGREGGCDLNGELAHCN